MTCAAAEESGHAGPDVRCGRRRGDTICGFADDCAVVESRATLASLSGTRISTVSVVSERPDLPGLTRIASPLRDPNELNVEVLFEDPLLVTADAHSEWGRRRKIDIAELVDRPHRLHGVSASACMLCASARVRSTKASNSGLSESSSAQPTDRRRCGMFRASRRRRSQLS